MKKNALHAISLVAILTLFAKGLGMVRDILQARAFGTSTIDIDLFTTANNGTIYLFTTAAYALCLAAIPIFAQKQSKSKQEAMKSANNLITITLLLSIVVVGVLFLAISLGWFGDGVGESGYSLRWYSGVMVFTLPLIVATYLLMALFQSMGHYSLQGSLSLLYNIVICGVLLLVGKHMTVPSFAILMSAAWFLQLAMVFPAAIREKYRFRFRMDFRAPELRTYWRTALVTAFTTSSFLLCYLLDTRQSAVLGVGVAASFSYADKLFTPITTTLIYSIGAVIFPKWSENYAKMEREEYRAYVGKVVENTVVLLLPLSALFSAFGIPIIRVLFEGGNFDFNSSVQTGGIFTCYMLGMVGFAMLDLLSKAFYATGKTKAPLLVNLGVLVLNFVLNLIILNVAPSASLIAGATAIAMVLGGIVLSVLFFAKTTEKIFSLRKICLGIIVSVMLFIGLWLGTDAFVSSTDSKMMLILKCGAMGVAALLVYFGVMWKELQLKKLLKKGEQEC